METPSFFSSSWSNPPPVGLLMGLSPRQRPNSRLAISWDGATYHKSQELREYLELVNDGKSPEEWQINCILFAPNAPEQNPVEDIWLQGKNLREKICLSL